MLCEICDGGMNGPLLPANPGPVVGMGLVQLSWGKDREGRVLWVEPGVGRVLRWLVLPVARRRPVPGTDS